MTTKPLVHIVAGPTASGKTDFAVELAKQLNGELINADSRQIYKYLDIGTNKGAVTLVDEEEINDQDYPVYFFPGTNVRIHLLSFLNPDQQFSVYDYQKLATTCITQIIARGKVPILVGGTGLYISAVMHPEQYKIQSASDNELREKLSSKTVVQLQTQLKKLNKDAFTKLNSSDQQNPRRLINLIIKLTLTQRKPVKVTKPKFALEIHDLSKPLNDLTPRINERVIEMFDQGIVAEVQHVLKLGFPEQSVALQGIGYKEVLSYINGEISLEKCIELVQIAHRQYARRQITWFKKYLK